jgi:uncharacterized membrane protein
MSRASGVNYDGSVIVGSMKYERHLARRVLEERPSSS